MGLINQILQYMANINILPSNFMHLSQGFETLELNGMDKMWSTSYLIDHRQSVEIDGISSGMFPLASSVPQRSMIGLLLFLIYPNDIPNCTDYFRFITYTEGTTLPNTINIPTGPCLMKIMHQLKCMIVKQSVNLPLICTKNM